MADRGTAKDFAAALDVAIAMQRNNGSCYFCEEIPAELRAIITERVQPRLAAAKAVPWASIARTLIEAGYTRTTRAKLMSHFESKHYQEGQV